MRTYLGVDIGGTFLKIGLVDENGQILDQEKYQVDFDDYNTPILHTVEMKTVEYLNGIPDQKAVEGIGVSATGQIDSKTGTVIGTAGHIPNYLGSQIGQVLKNVTGLDVYVANDANCALLGECWTGGARGRSDVVMITIGTGVGGGILVNGRLLTGHRGLGGEVGHIIINDDGEKCTCGNRGCLEHYASTKKLVENVRNAGIAGFSSDITGKTVYDYLKQGKPGESTYDALFTVVDDWTGKIADGLVSLVHIFEPEEILIGGGISEAGPVFLDAVAGKVKSRVMPAFRQQLEIHAAALGNRAGLIGAVAYFRQQKGEKMNSYDDYSVKSR